MYTLIGSIRYGHLKKKEKEYGDTKKPRLVKQDCRICWELLDKMKMRACADCHKKCSVNCAKDF